MIFQQITLFILLFFPFCRTQDEEILPEMDGITVPDAGNEIRFKLSGPGKIIGIENGRLIMVRVTNKTGQIVMSADSEGLKQQTSSFTQK